VEPALRSGNRERVSGALTDPTGEFSPGETIVKLYYCKRLGRYVTIPGASLFKLAADCRTLEESC